MFAYTLATLPQAVLISGKETKPLYAWLETQLNRPIQGHPDCQILVPEGKQALHSIEGVRAQLAQAQLPPMQAIKRIFIIEEAEKLGPAGSNALLKTLEEPPPHAIFILFASKPLLPTLVSRCFPLRLPVKAQDLKAPAELFAATTAVCQAWGHFPSLQLAIQQLVQQIQSSPTQAASSKELFSSAQVEQMTREAQGQKTLAEQHSLQLVLQWILAWAHDLERLEQKREPIIFADCREIMLNQLGVIDVRFVDRELQRIVQRAERSLPLAAALEGFFLRTVLV